MLNNSSGPGGGSASAATDGNNGTHDIVESPNVVAALSPHASAAIPIASLVLPASRPVPTTNPTPSSLSAKQFLIRRVRSRSKSDPQSVPDKSLFSRFFPKRTKKPLGSLLTATTKSIEAPGDLHHQQKKRSKVTSNLLTATYQAEDDDDEFDERVISTGSLSDTDQQTSNDTRITSSQSSTGTRAGSRTNSGNARNISAGPNILTLPTSDSQYYASMSSAPRGFSISYHKRMSKGADDLRIQAAFGRIQQQSKQNVSTGASQLLVRRTNERRRQLLA